LAQGQNPKAPAVKREARHQQLPMRDTVIFVVILSLIVAAVFTLVFFGLS